MHLPEFGFYEVRSFQDILASSWLFLFKVFLRWLTRWNFRVLKYIISARSSFSASEIDNVCVCVFSLV